ncbi:MAG: DMT family transporter [Nitrospirae bacterium]|nr:DMT family transporter [Nitrospirota bacterium]
MINKWVRSLSLVFVILAGILLGLFSALAWGAGDFIAKRTVDKIGPYVTLFYMFLVGTVLLGLLTFFVIGTAGPLDRWMILVILLSSILGVLGYFCLYYGFQIGFLSVVSTITAAGTIVPVGLLLLILQEWPTRIQLLGIVLIILGVTLVSFKRQPEISPAILKKRLGVIPAIFSALFFGSYVVLIKIVSLKTGPILPIFIVRGMGVILIGLTLIYRKEMTPPPKATWKYLLAIGVLDAAAFLAFTVGITRTLVAIVAPLSSLFTLVTVILARVILKEQLAFHQKWGFWMVLIGVLTLSSQ